MFSLLDLTLTCITNRIFVTGVFIEALVKKRYDMPKELMSCDPSLMKGKGELKDYPNKAAYLADKAKFDEDSRRRKEVYQWRREKYCELIVGGFKGIINEIRGRKVYMDPAGAPVRRTQAKKTLKKIDV